MFRMVLERMEWMDRKGIKQWNVTKYDEVYPLSYYEDKRKKGQVYVLEDTEKEQIVCAAVLMEEDARWDDNPPALYLHNFVSVMGERGVGPVFIHEAEKLAQSMGKEYFRLDSADDNRALESYYDALGFIAVGHCVDGLYSGILREKKLPRQT